MRYNDVCCILVAAFYIFFAGRVYVIVLVVIFFIAACFHFFTSSLKFLPFASNLRGVYIIQVSTILLCNSVRDIFLNVFNGFWVIVRGRNGVTIT